MTMTLSPLIEIMATLAKSPLSSPSPIIAT